MNIFKLPLYSTALFFLISPVAIASQPIKDISGLEKLLSLDIEELLTVSVASKKEETIREAPSIISVITKEDIIRYGALNLSDILNRIPSLQMYSSPFLPNNPLSIRGQSNQHYPNRILFLINGRPFRDFSSGGWVSPLLTEFPTSAIDKLEVIRGPGSVLYGSGAFSGVINIITKNKVKNGVAEVSSTLGSFGRRDFEGSSGNQGENWGVYGAVKDSYSSGWSSSLTAESGTSGTLDIDEDGNGYFLNGYYHGLSLNAFKGRSEETSLGATIRFPKRPLEINRTFVDIGYELEISDRWIAHFNTTYNSFVLDKNSSTGNADNTEINILGETSLKGEISDNVSIILGMSFENHDGEISNLDYQTQSSNGYAQVDYKPLRWLKLIGGMQLNKPKNIKKRISPRAAVIAFLDDNWTVKVMYGHAFRAASAVEAFINIPGALVGNSAVKPEKIETSEIQILYENHNYNASVTVYRSRITDIIGRVPFGGGGSTLENIGEDTYEGLELEGKKYLGKGWTAEGSLLFQRSESSDDLENPNFTTNIMAKGGVTYESDNGWTIGIFDSYFGDPEDVRGANASVLEINPQPKSYHMVTGNLDLNIPKLLGKEGLMPDATFTIFGENLLNEDIHYPEFNRKNINSIPIEGGRAIYGKLSIKF